jgi:uncharacterized membrane protein
MSAVVVYLAVAVPFLMIDAIWLKVMGQRMYRATLGDILLAKPRLWPATLFYSAYPLGVMWFAVPYHHDGNPMQALGSGSLFGCFTYATYGLTNHATLRNWTTRLTLTDVIFGAAIAACCSYSGYVAATWLL